MEIDLRKLERFWREGVYPRGYPMGLARPLMRKLQMLNAACALHDLMVPPGNHLERLRGDLDGFWSIRVNQQYRLVFRWDDREQEARDVYFDDYHR
ncbi:type II toxin-antitoxin system RelE/ParE family toxin [Bifidobacterium sp. ESL0763]|uniref:type II toxin-antitoxin system RelE/ParE family toxin n=1 Tax=Bifidobacterium sp. ESL0763 TaxID=2983227 RepID=UPI0023F63005|nr:type II toxin-antitoxin system RelE/ParE family toxin [Bifidobacterium sp. ESL0763]MDF7664488.1 type II toxin-antitoxin system RelE/ParE family toxin [Bifidobacterium sp. ESL0763]